MDKKINILDIARQALDIEVQEMLALRDRLDHHFEQAVQLIAAQNTRLIIVGIGKSAHIANKMVATFNSTGTPAQFLHAAEAMHGDLGMIDQNNVVICISNSGNSPEIAVLAPILRQRASALIAFTGNLNSKLAQEAHVVLNTKVSQEACPNKLAPTSSTTVQMALGDALAVCLMQLEGFKAENFAHFHPGGALGKNLMLKVENLLSGEKPEVDENANIREVIMAITSSKHGITAVNNAQNALVGVITDGDLRRMLLNIDDFRHLKAKDIMSHQPKTIQANAMATQAMQMMKNHNISQLIVCQNQEYIGVVHIHQLLDEGIQG